MVRPRTDDNPPKRRPPARTPEAREQEMIGLAIDLAEKQIKEGRVSAQVLVHYLRLPTEKDKLERTKLRRENELLAAKVESLASMARTEEMYSNALKAMRQYGGHVDEDDYDYS